MRDYQFDRSMPIPRGRVVFEVRNAGRTPHRMALIAMPPGSPSVADLVSGAQAMRVTPMAGTPAIVAGGSDSFAVDLMPGRYLMVDLGYGPDRQSNVRRGMAADFQVA